MKTNHLVFMSFSLAVVNLFSCNFSTLAQQQSQQQQQEYRPTPSAAPQKPKMYGGGYVHAPLPSRDAFAQPAAAHSNNQQALREPTYQRSNEEASVQRVEAPQIVPIDQAHTQDLSMPDDQQQQSNSGGQSPSTFSRNKKQLENNFIRKPLMNIRSRLGI
ncbi:MAG: hypothetical protein U0103_06675 [Candidatus Obscuribacterales bacterium]|nr:hypothetical protein [Cyanobacteria bacterium SZAS LIN-5]RTL41417.1 MAG: hypothetical protein EKK48_13710 [Candidatus Melainabacteria bacterium]